MPFELIGEVGEWARDKHSKLRLYVNISRAARRRYTSRTEATYIDLFCGPGQCRVREDGGLIDGSSIVAFRAGRESSVPFTAIHIADVDEAAVRSSEHRLASQGAPVHMAVGPAKQTVEIVMSGVNPLGLHFALLDPFNLGDLPFSVIKALSSLRRIDLLIHLSTGDLQRNLGKDYLAPGSETLDQFAPGWRDRVATNTSTTAIRAAVIDYWFSLLKDLGFDPSTRMVPVRNGKGSTMYWLVFASRAPIANKFWEEAIHYNPQKYLF